MNTEINNIVTRIKTIKNERQNKLEKLNKTIKQEKVNQKDAEDALVFVTKVFAEIRKELEIHLSGIVTNALNLVFPDKYRFNIEHVFKYNKTAIDMYLTDSDGNRLDDVLESVGGGVADVCSIALRLACIHLAGLPKVIVLDEPFRAVSKDKHCLIAQMLKEFSKQLQVQWIIITHEMELLNENVIDLEAV
jgi:DNA repair ATPase RecN